MRIWKTPYRDPTYIHLLFYFANQVSDLVADWNELAQYIQVEGLTGETVRVKVEEMLKSKRKYRYEFWDNKPFKVMLHAYGDEQYPETCILQIVHAPGKEEKKPEKGWNVVSTVPWAEAQRCFGSSQLFVVNTTTDDYKSLRDELLQVIKEVTSPMALHSNPSEFGSGFGGADLGFGYIEDLRPSHDLFLLIPKHQEPMPKEANRFQCVYFPQLEMYRHQSLFCDDLFSRECRLVQDAMDNNYDSRSAVHLLKLNPQRIQGDLRSVLQRWESVASTVNPSLDECQCMYNSIKKACDNYQRILERYVKPKPQDELWTGILLSFDPLLQSQLLDDCRRTAQQLNKDIETLKERLKQENEQITGGEPEMDYKEQLPSFLVDELKKGNGVLFIGAGLSIGAELPSWKQLIEPLVDEIGCPKDNLLKIPQYYVQHHGSRVPLYQYLKRKIKVPDATPTENHRLLVQLPVGVIFTTNYDELLEDTLREERIPFHHIVLDKGIGGWNEAEEVQLVKLHGSIDDEETIIITEDDYRTYFQKHPAMRKQLSSLLMTKTFLFVGYSLNDPNFNFVYDEIQTYLGKEKRPAFSIMFNVNQFDINDYRNRGLLIINITVGQGEDYSVALQNVLEALVKAVKGTEEEQQDSSPERPQIEKSATTSLSDRMVEEQLTRREMREVILNRYPDEDDFRTLCDDLDEIYFPDESGRLYGRLSGSNLEAKARELISYFERRGKSKQLINELRQRSVLSEL